MRGNIRRRFIGAAIMMFMTVGCTASPSNPSNPSATKSRVVSPSSVQTQVRTDSPEQKDAQRAWCEYLDALHRRAATAGDEMPSLQKCMEARTYASPQMLRHTARCSREALDQFDGDPFTDEYASAVARCGADALDSCEAAAADLEPFVMAICSCVNRCGDADYAQCKTLLDGGLSLHLSRAVGTMNGQGKQAFEGCLKKLTCGDVGSQIVECLDPIMDKLLWLPE